MSEAKGSMDQVQHIEAVRKELLERKRELEQDMVKLEQEKFIEDAGGQDIGDQTLNSMMENLRSSLQDTKIGDYKRIVDALTMIDDGTYGICSDCQKPISEKRLKSFPNATRCIACQEAFEEGE